MVSREIKTKRPYIIGVAGGSASGKTSVCNIIKNTLNTDLFTPVSVISIDSFYKPLITKNNFDIKDYNFDHPNAFDFLLLYEVLNDLLHGKSVHIPIYDYTTHSRLKDKELIQKTDIIIIEGILAFFDEKIRKLMDIKIFVDTDSDECLSRRIQRDMVQRGRSLQSILDQYKKFVKPSFDSYIFPTKKYADIIIPRGAKNKIALDMIISNIEKRIKDSSVKKDKNIRNYLLGVISSQFDQEDVIEKIYKKFKKY